MLNSGCDLQYQTSLLKCIVGSTHGWVWFLNSSFKKSNPFCACLLKWKNVIRFYSERYRKLVCWRPAPPPSLHPNAHTHSSFLSNQPLSATDYHTLLATMADKGLSDEAVAAVCKDGDPITKVRRCFHVWKREKRRRSNPGARKCNIPTVDTWACCFCITSKLVASVTIHSA